MSWVLVASDKPLHLTLPNIKSNAAEITDWSEYHTHLCFSFPDHTQLMLLCYGNPLGRVWYRKRVVCIRNRRVVSRAAVKHGSGNLSMLSAAERGKVLVSDNT